MTLRSSAYGYVQLSPSIGFIERPADFADLIGMSMLTLTSAARLSDCLIAFWRIALGLLVATVIAPPLAGAIYAGAELVTMMSRPNQILDAAGGVLMAAFMFLVAGFTTALRITACIALPGVVLMRWMGLASPAVCAVGGGFAAGTGSFIFLDGASPRIDSEIDWLLVAAIIGAGALVAWLYWWIAERPFAVAARRATDRG